MGAVPAASELELEARGILALTTLARAQWYGLARRGSRGDHRQETPGLERAEHDPTASEVVARVEPYVHLDERAEAVQRRRRREPGVRGRTG